ncbi:MAG: peptidoglycan glycosyltransferase, partial [Spirochaetota bacterium]
MRFRIFIVFTGIIVLLLIWQYFSIMVLHRDVKNDTADSPPLVERGPILDRNGRILAIQTRLNSVTAWTPSVEN